CAAWSAFQGDRNSERVRGVNGPAARIAAQAKLNLHLRVFPREASGYHSIETVFHRIDLSDELLVETGERGRSIDVEGMETGPPEQNLAFRAAVAYSTRAGWPRGFRIELKKKIPVGAGLGGGSADAAGVLRVLDSLSPTPVGNDALIEIAASLGSDIPFLASDAVMAFAWGHGERMMRFDPLPSYELLLMTPPFSVSTADAYRWLDDDRATASAPLVPGGNPVSRDTPSPLMISPLALSTWPGIIRFAKNDFENHVIARHPKLAGYIERLRQSRAIFAQMTGSGSTIFGVLNSPPNYSRVPEELRRHVITTKTSIDVVQPVRVG
ncbi:MAG: 4-(cytidine 5'-diphospho)-2-C-methyl-D-erythritol kinase, partial [Gemmatimonadaceae bacterium]